MRTISEELAEELNSGSQTVTPKVVARFADNRFLDNLEWSSSSELPRNQILRFNPELFLTFDEFDYIAYSTSEKPYNISNHGKGAYDDLRFLRVAGDYSPYGFTKEYGTHTDNFTRSNSTTQLDFIDDGTDDGFNGWIQAGGALWGISGNEAYISAFDQSVDAPAGVALINGVGDNGVIEFTLGSSTIDTMGVIIAAFPEEDLFNPGLYTYGNWEFFGFNFSATFSSSSFVYGSLTNLTNGIDSQVESYSDGDVIRIEYSYKDCFVVKVYKNGTIVHDYTDTSWNFPVFRDMSQPNIYTPDSRGGGYVGLFCNNASSFSTARWADFSVTAYDPYSNSAKIEAANGYVTAAQTATIDQFDDFTMGFWIKRESLDVVDNILQYFYSSADQKFAMGVDGTALTFSLFDDSSVEYAYLTSASALIENEWSHIVVRKFGTSIDFFSNGVNIGSFTAPSATYHYASTTYQKLELASTTYDSYFDDFFITFEELTDKQILSMYYAGINTGTFSHENFNAEQAVNCLSEQTFAWAICDDMDEFGNVVVSNGEYKFVSDEYKIDDEYAWVSRSKSDGSGNFTDEEFAWYEFDSRKATGFIISTGYTSSRVKDFSYVFVKSDLTEISGSSSFTEGESTKEITFDDAYDIIAAKIKMDSTWVAESLGRIHEVLVVYDVDISDDVISMSVDKLRDDYESTIPIGLTSSNTGSLTLNNTHKMYNPTGTSDYAPYIVPDTEFFISLVYDLGNNQTEEVKLADSMYAESWELSSDNMQVSVPLADFSKYLQEMTPSSGFVWKDTVAAKAIIETALFAGVPRRKCVFTQPYYREILDSRPWAFWRLSNSSAVDIVDEGGNYDMKIFGSNITRGVAPIIEQEKTNYLYTEDRNSVLSTDANKYIPYSTQFNGGTTTYADIDGYVMGTEFQYDASIEVTVSPASVPSAASYYFIAGDGYPGDQPVLCVYLEEDGGSYYIRSTSYVGSTQYDLEYGPLTSAEVIDQTFHIIALRNGSTNYLYINGELADSVAVGASANAANGVWAIGGSDAADAGSRHTFDGKISSVSVWNRALSSDEVEKHYIATQLDTFYVFSYLYYNEETPWEAMLNFAAADVGMFYFDEDGFLNYEYRNTFHENINTRHTQSQYDLDESTNIIAGSVIVEVQTNRVIVIVNPKAIVNENYESVWRADEGASLALSTLAQDFGANDTEIFLTDTESPLWPDSGYFKIGEEIIQYASKEDGRLYGLTRGMFGTNNAFATVVSGQQVREVRVYNIEYSNAPVLNVKYPFLTASIFDKTAKIDKFVTTPFGAEVIVSAEDEAVDGDLVILEGTNPLTEINNYFSIAGIPVDTTKNNEKVVEEIRDISVRTRKYRNKELTIDNEFIQDKNYARSIANYLVKYFGVPIPIIEVEVHGIPHLQLGDLVTIIGFDQLDISNKMYWVIESTISYDGGIKQSLVLREFTEGLSE